MTHFLQTIFRCQELYLEKVESTNKDNSKIFNGSNELDYENSKIKLQSSRAPENNSRNIFGNNLTLNPVSKQISTSPKNLRLVNVFRAGFDERTIPNGRFVTHPQFEKESSGEVEFLSSFNRFKIDDNEEEPSTSNEDEETTRSGKSSSSVIFCELFDLINSSTSVSITESIQISSFDRCSCSSTVPTFDFEIIGNSKSSCETSHQSDASTNDLLIAKPITIDTGNIFPLVPTFYAANQVQSVKTRFPVTSTHPPTRVQIQAPHKSDSDESELSAANFVIHNFDIEKTETITGSNKHHGIQLTPTVPLTIASDTPSLSSLDSVPIEKENFKRYRSYEPHSLNDASLPSAQSKESK